MNSQFTIAVHSLVYLAHVPDHMASSDQIASNVCTHAARIRKVMGTLRRAGYVDTKEGIGGGYHLLCAAGDINLGDVYRYTAEGSIRPNWCSGDVTKPCVVAANITSVMDGLFEGAETRLIDYFSELTIRDLLHQLRAVQTNKS